MRKERWTKDKMPSLEGKVAIVTGANSGLGYETTLALTEKDCEVVMACRNEEKGAIAMNNILGKVPKAKVVLMVLDLSDLQSVKQFSVLFRNKYDKLDLLINNAGVMALPYSKTVDGFEMQFGVNHLGHFALSSHLIDMMKGVVGARIVSVASMAYMWGGIQYDDIHWEKKYVKMRAYGMSKLANLLFSKELADLLKDSGSSIKAMAAHPGYADSSLFEKGPMLGGRKSMVSILRAANRFIAQDTSMGALPILYAATNDSAENGAYYGPGGLFGMKGYPKQEKMKGKKVNKAEQEKLWELSEELSALRIDI